MPPCLFHTIPCIVIFICRGHLIHVLILQAFSIEDACFAVFPRLESFLLRLCLQRNCLFRLEHISAGTFCGFGNPSSVGKYLYFLAAFRTDPVLKHRCSSLALAAIHYCHYDSSFSVRPDRRNNGLPLYICNLSIDLWKRKCQSEFR